MLKLENVTKTFGGNRALDNVSFQIEEGEFVFLMGPSGAGKTTLLRLILRELKPDKGKIILDKKDIVNIPKKEVPELRQTMGVVFQDFKVLHDRTLRENVEVALAVEGIDEEEWDKRVKHVIDLVGLSGKDDLFPSQLAGGELQRTALARALVVNPKIIMADEPTGNIDWGTAYKIMELFNKINKEGKTILVASHHETLVEKMNKRVITLEEGKLVSDSADSSKKTKDKNTKK